MNFLTFAKEGFCDTVFCLPNVIRITRMRTTKFVHVFLLYPALSAPFRDTLNFVFGSLLRYTTFPFFEFNLTGVL
mgnify:CR=1 FL=1